MRLKKKILAVSLSFIFIFGQTLSGLAALTSISTSVVSSDSMGTKMRASVYSNTYADLEDGKAAVNYAVYRDGSAVTGFINPAVAEGGITQPTAGTYKRDYVFDMYKPTYNNLPGSYTVVAQSVYNGVYVTGSAVSAFNNRNASDFIMASGGYEHSIALKADGTVWAWGATNHSVGSKLKPTLLTDISNVIKVDAGGLFSIALKNDGTVWTWGINNSEQLGHSDMFSYNTTPTMVPGLNNIVNISGGADHVLALKSDGTVWAWGNSYANGRTTKSSIPMQIPGLNNVIEISAGSGGSLALKSDGTVWAWGYNIWGQLGNGTNMHSVTPVRVSGLENVISISYGCFFGIALKKDGTVWTWGQNDDGALGTGNFFDSSVPVRVNSLNHIVSIACGEGHILALKSDGEVWTWGRNNFGQLGNGTTQNSENPIHVQSIHGITSLGMGTCMNHSIVIRNDESLWAWGYNVYGQLGNGANTNSSIPVQVTTSSGGGGGGGPTTVTAVSASIVNVAMSIGGICQLTATVSPSNATNKSVTWYTYNSSVVTVSSTGLLTAVGVGSTKVRATSVSNPACYVEYTIDVLGLPSVTIDKTNLILEEGQAEQLAANITYIPGVYNNYVSWTSSNSSVAAVSTSGVLTAVSEGTAKITATSITNSVYHAETSVTVVDKKVTFSDAYFEKLYGLASIHLFDVTYNNGTYIAVGMDGTIKTSQDSISWVRKESGVTNTLYSIENNGNIFVAVGEKGTIITSQDGSTWMQRTSGATKNLFKVIWGGNRFVAVGLGGTILTSEDGMTWTKRESNTSKGLHYIAWSGTRFVAAGAEGVVMSSQDGITWTQGISPFPYFYYLFWNGTKFVISKYASNTTSYVATSIDGISWVSGLTYFTPQGKSAWNGSYYIMEYSGDIYKSFDGENWIKIVDDIIAVYYGIDEIIWDGHQFVGVGRNSFIITSPDGYTWTVREDGKRTSFNKVIWGGDKFVAVGSEGNIFTSINGKDWTKRESGIIDDIITVVWNGSSYLATGYFFGVLKSTDGVNWIKQDANLTTYPNSIVWNGSMFVAVGSNKVSFSSDGLTWVSKDYSTNGSQYYVGWHNNQFIACDGYGVWTSPDGFTWTRRLEQTDPLRYVAFNGSLYVAVGGWYHDSTGVANEIEDEGWTTIYTSTDSINWTKNSFDGGVMLNSVIWDGSQFIAAGAEGLIATSPDGITWTKNSLNTELFLTSIAWNGKYFAVVGAYGQNYQGYAPVTSITINKTSTTLTPGRTEQLTASIIPDNASDKTLTWSTSNSPVSTVSSTGMVTAVSNGTAIIKAASIQNPEKYAECTVTVSTGGSGGGNSTGNNQGEQTITTNPGNGTPIISTSASLDSSSGRATATISSSTLTSAFSEAKANNDGVKTVAIEIPKVEGARAYEPTLPASFLTTAVAHQRVEIKTDVATVVVPSNMIKPGEAQNAANIALTIAPVDKSALDASTKAAIGDRPVIELNVKVDGSVKEWNNPDAPVSVSLPYKPSAEEMKDPEHIVVWYIDGAGKAVSVPSGRYNAATETVTFKTTHFSRYAVAYVEKSFEDISAYDWAKKQIEVLASKGVINGTSEMTYTPAANVTRADFLLLLVNTLGLTASFEGNFSDVVRSDYYYEALGTAKKLGICEGTGDNLFNPRAEISRQDMMTLAARALKIAKKLNISGEVKELGRFSDASSTAAYAQESIAYMVKEEIVQGDGNVLNPLGNATRAETAVLMYRIYNK